MKVKRVVANFATEKENLQQARAFYQDILGLDLLMDHGWIQTYGSQTPMSIQVSFASEGGSGTPVPDLSIEVDDLDQACQRMQDAGIAIEYGPVTAIRLAGWLIYWFIFNGGGLKRFIKAHT